MKRKIEINRQSLADELFKWRNRQGLLQREVAEMANVSRYTIIRTEMASDAVSIATLYRLSNFLNSKLREESGAL